MRTRRVLLIALTAAVAAPASAHAADKPYAATSTTEKLTFNSVQLVGRVNPRNVSTQFNFQYGVQGKLTAATPIVAGDGSKTITARAPVTGLTPATKYYFRVVATNSGGTTYGRVHTFVTKKQPLGLSLGATPNPVPYGSPVTITGNLSGTGNNGQPVVLNANPFPYTQGFKAYTNPVVTDKDGNFSIASTSLLATTQFQAKVSQRPVTSPTFTLPVVAKVATKASKTKIKRGRKLHLSGSVQPASDGVSASIQKKSPSGKWVTVASTSLRHSASGRSSYGRSITMSRGGTYRVMANLSGAVSAGTGPEIKIRTYR